MISPRSAKTKVAESAIDLTVLALGLSLLFEVLRASGVQVPDGMEAKATAFAMAADGIHESDAELAWQGTQLLEKMRP